MREKELLFSKKIKGAGEEGRSKEYFCEVLRKDSFLEVRFTEQLDLFNLLICKIDEKEYYQMKEIQGIRVDYYLFQRKLIELLERVYKEELTITFLKNKALIVERNDFKNIVQVELLVSPIADAQLKGYASEILKNLQLENMRYKRDSSLLKEETERKESMLHRTISQLEEEASEYRRRYEETLPREKTLAKQLEEVKEKETLLLESEKRYKHLYEQLSEEKRENAGKVDRASRTENELREKERHIKSQEEDLRKANEIIKKNFEEIRDRRKEIIHMQQEMKNLAEQKEDVENKALQ
ncbi:hypothetical protein NEFER01_1391, partial [Nematocida sp. LUAm1]